MLSHDMPNYYFIADNKGEIGILVALQAKYFKSSACK